MEKYSFLSQVRHDVAGVVSQRTPEQKRLFGEFKKLHPADIAQFLAHVNGHDAKLLYFALPKKQQIAVFTRLSVKRQIVLLNQMPEKDKRTALDALQAEELCDLFDGLSDAQLKAYLDILHKRKREHVLSLMKFHPESAGGIMDIKVFSLRDDFTVQKSIDLLRRITSSEDIYRQVYVTGFDDKLLGYINLEDLVLQPPDAKVSSFMRPNEFVARADQDQESIAERMVHYGLTNVPVVGKNDYFLGVIPADTLTDVILQETREDVQKMAALAPHKETYFDVSFAKMLYERSYILVILLLVESFSSTILNAYEATLAGFFSFFIPMIISTGGNTSSQTSAVVIQGMAAGAVTPRTMWRFLKREWLMAGMLALILAATSFVRVYYTSGLLLHSVAISISLGIIVMLSVTLGSGIPLILKKLKIDPAFAAGPFLATVMDIFGVLIYCYICRLILF